MKGKTTPLILCLLLLVLCLPGIASAATEQRLALVIGNGSYETGPLRNPANDATDMASALKSLGFEVILKKNVRHQEMEEAVESFGKHLRRGGVGLFYYAGHGVQVGGVNYLLPIGAKINKESDVKHQSVSAEKVLDEMAEANNGLNIVLLDACRDNPYARSIRSASRGLAIISSAPEGTFISYATGPGQTAKDGEGRNSPYTAALLKNIKKPGLPIEKVFKQVRVELSRQKQTPWELSSLKGEFYFRPGKEEEAAPSQETETPPAATARQDYAMARPPAPPEDDREFTSPTLGAKFVLIPAGTFMMGSPSSESGRDNSETQHRVTINQPFYMQTTEVTQGQWKRLMGHNPSHFSSCGEDCPVEQVSWSDVQDFIRKLNSMEGTDKYRLPTEAQWEYAARAGTTTPFNTGDCLGTEQANYDGNNPQTGCPKGEYRRKTMRVGSFSPNAWGLYDMHGNVWEWVQDWKGDYPSGSVNDPEGPSSGSYRVYRGGSWDNSARVCRSAIRLHSFPGNRYNGLGFRLLRTL
jgi:formylglycine-generating enzyme required for sulfatase activity